MAYAIDGLAFSRYDAVGLLVGNPVREFRAAKRNWGFYRKAHRRAKAWIPPEFLGEWYQEIVDDPASGERTRDSTVFYRHFEKPGQKTGTRFRFWYKSPYTSPLTGEDWNGMIVCVEIARAGSKLDRGHEKEMLTLIGKLLDAITEGLKLGRVVIERIPRGFSL